MIINEDMQIKNTSACNLKLVKMNVCFIHQKLFSTDSSSIFVKWKSNNKEENKSKYNNVKLYK